MSEENRNFKISGQECYCARLPWSEICQPCLSMNAERFRKYLEEQKKNEPIPVAAARFCREALEAEEQ